MKRLWPGRVPIGLTGYRPVRCRSLIRYTDAMHGGRVILRVFLLVLVGGFFVAPAAADECRGELRPLLLSRDHDQAAIDAVRSLCEREYAAGSADAGYQLALIDLGLDGWSPERATPLIREAANRGVAEAQYWLAWQYETGPLLDNDEATALYWYQAAAEQDHRLALQRLADAYEHGELGLKVNTFQAAQFRARAQRCARKQALALDAG